jgi:hypothetical protein
MSGDVLALVLDALLPGGDGFPAASAIGLADWLRGRADFAAPAQAVVELLPEGFSLNAAVGWLPRGAESAENCRHGDKNSEHFGSPCG